MHSKARGQAWPRGLPGVRALLVVDRDGQVLERDDSYDVRHVDSRATSRSLTGMRDHGCVRHAEVGLRSFATAVSIQPPACSILVQATAQPRHTRFCQGVNVVERAIHRLQDFRAGCCIRQKKLFLR
jgi:hypothetical protein